MQGTVKPCVTGHNCNPQHPLRLQVYSSYMKNSDCVQNSTGSIKGFDLEQII